jgi:hypothetical protein
MMNRFKLASLRRSAGSSAGRAGRGGTAKGTGRDLARPAGGPRGMAATERAKKIRKAARTSMIMSVLL